MGETSIVRSQQRIGCVWRDELKQSPFFRNIFLRDSRAHYDCVLNEPICIHTERRNNFC